MRSLYALHGLADWNFTTNRRLMSFDSFLTGTLSNTEETDKMRFSVTLLPDLHVLLRFKHSLRIDVHLHIQRVI